ncbi:NAD(P)/FAD-dependent oxidoreductase [Pantoea sp. App145]|uniref:NAD(P)/FAD-dependent oxidoreductase n=1 Tax=Pantoea sp. App145 TaxID=3071567 RepID=UPI003A8136C4
MSNSPEHLLDSAGTFSDYLAQRTEPPIETSVLQGDQHTDVVIIGAGFTGLSCALELSERGVSNLVLEAREIGWGASGRAWGQVAAAAKFMPAQIEKDFPPEIAGRINRAAELAPDLVFGLIRQHDMRCDAVQNGNIIAAHNADKAQWIRSTATDLQSRGYPVRLLEAEDVSALTGSPRYRCALIDERGGALNPLGYARGLARAAQTAGSQIFTQSPLLSLQKVGADWQVTTPQGRVTARQVVMATGAFTGNLLQSQTQQEIFPVRAYQAISEPLTTEVLSTLLPGGQPFNDTRRMFSGVRVWPDGRLHVGLDGPLFRANASGWLQGATKRLQLMFPQLRDLRWAYHWAGWVDMTVDHYPRLHRLAPGVLAAYGFSGRGVAIGTLMGRDLAHLALGHSEDQLVHPVSAVQPQWYHAIHRPLVQTLVTGYRVEDRHYDNQYARSVPSLHS